MVLTRINFDCLEPLRVRQWVIEDIGIRDELCVAVTEILFGFAGQTAIGCATVTQLTLFPRRSRSIWIAAWEQRKLGEIVLVTMGQSPNGACYTDNPNDAVLVQGNADLKDGWVSPRVWTTAVTKTAKAGDLIMSVRAPVGAMGKTAYDVVLGRGVAGIAGNEFLFQALSKKEAEGYWSTVSAGSTFDSINGDELRNTPVNCPRSELECETIGDCLSKVDSLITLHQREPPHMMKEGKNANRYQ